MTKLRAIVIAALTTFAPIAAQACPKCFDATDGNALNAYFLSLGMLSFLPLGIIAGIVWWVVSSHRKAHRESE